MLPWNNFPFNDEMKNMINQKNSNTIDKYVHDMISKMLPKTMEEMVNPQEWMKGTTSFQQAPDQHTSESGLQASIFETHDFVFIRIPIQEEIWLRDIKVFHTSNELIIENIPHPNNKNTYQLPVPVKKKGANASYKDHILEIKILRSVQTQISEVFIPDQ